MTGPEAAIIITAMLVGMLILGGLGYLVYGMHDEEEKVMTLAMIGMPVLALMGIGLAGLVEAFV